MKPSLKPGVRLILSLVLTLSTDFAVLHNSHRAFADITLPHCQAQSPANTTCWLSLNEIRPSQPAVGLRQVQRTTQKMRAMPLPELHKLLQKKIAPIVIGPGGAFQLVDRHHQSRAYLDFGGTTIPVKIIQNWSDVSPRRFWNQMESSGYAYLRDSQGQAISPRQLPAQLADLPDNPYRSLAGDVQDAGGFDKSKMVYFIEFHWALFFRQHLGAVDLNSDEGYQAALKKAYALACSTAAQNMPGWTGCL